MGPFYIDPVQDPLPVTIDETLQGHTTKVGHPTSNDTTLLSFRRERVYTVQEGPGQDTTV